MAALSIQKKVDSVVVATSGTTTDVLDITNHKGISLMLAKTGSGTGTAKLQQSNDGTNWVDVNTTLWPQATSAVGAGAQTVFLQCESYASMIRVTFTEAGTNSVTLSGKWIAKLH